MKTQKLVTSSMLVAISVLLSFIQIFRLPFGGSVTFASMLPIVLISYLYGLKYGVMSSLIYSVIQLIISGGIVSALFLPGEGQMPFFSALGVCFLDYILAYSMLGLGGIFRRKITNEQLSVCMGAITALLLRYIVHIISGTLFFGVWAQWFFADKTGLAQIPGLSGFCAWVMSHMNGMGLVLFYSICYNGAYMIPETVITAILAPIVVKTKIIMRNK